MPRLRTSFHCYPLVLALALIPQAAPAEMALRNVKVGDQVPDFTARTLDAKPVAKADYKGKVLLLLFARPKHAKSRTALVAAERIAQTYKDTRLSLLAVSTKPNGETHFRGLARECGLTYPIALDPDREMYGAFGLIVSPTTLLIDGTGILRFELGHMPPNYEARLRIHIDLLLGRIDHETHDARLEQTKSNKVKATKPAHRQLALAKRLAEQGKFQAAVLVLAKLDDAEEAVAVATLLGVCYLELGQIEKAAARLDPIADHKPPSVELKLALARLELGRGQETKAETHLLEARRLAPHHGRVLHELGRLYERQGKLTEALECYRLALEAIYGPRP